MRVLPTGRDPATNLALSSRNSYLTPASLKVAPVLYRALCEGRSVWQDPKWSSAPNLDSERVRSTLEAARKIVHEEAERCKREGVVNLRLDYISLNHPRTLENLENLPDSDNGTSFDVSDGAILSGAALLSEGECGKQTRLIDNLLLGFSLH